MKPTPQRALSATITTEVNRVEARKPKVARLKDRVVWWGAGLKGWIVVVDMVISKGVRREGLVGEDEPAHEAQGSHGAEHEADEGRRHGTLRWLKGVGRPGCSGMSPKISALQQSATASR